MTPDEHAELTERYEILDALWRLEWAAGQAATNAEPTPPTYVLEGTD